MSCMAAHLVPWPDPPCQRPRVGRSGRRIQIDRSIAAAGRTGCHAVQLEALPFAARCSRAPWPAGRMSGMQRLWQFQGRFIRAGATSRRWRSRAGGSWRRRLVSSEMSQMRRRMDDQVVIHGAGYRIALAPVCTSDLLPVYARDRRGEDPFTGSRPATKYFPVLFQVPALVLVPKGDSRRWRNGDPIAGRGNRVQWRYQHYTN